MKGRENLIEDIEVESCLLDMLETADNDENGGLTGMLMEATEADEFPNLSIQTFADAEILTNNRGLVLRWGNTEFQLTIVRSK